ncbi:MAG: phosphoribosylaminoimidazolesuccinocarboxamide synthase, partial [Microvirga sp.]
RFQAGAAPESFDKDFVRNWVASRCDPYNEPVPEIPRDVILETAAVYVRAFETITATPFAWPDPGVPVLERIRANLAAFF